MEPSYSSSGQQGGAAETSSSEQSSPVPYQIHNLETVAEENEECADGSTLPRNSTSSDHLVLGVSQATQTPADDCYLPLKHQGRSIYEGIIGSGGSVGEGSPVSARDADGGETRPHKSISNASTQLVRNESK